MYEYSIYENIHEVDLEEWYSAGATGLMMCPRFISVVESSMSKDLRAWHAVFREGSRPVGCASFALYRADACALAAPRLRGLLAAVRAVVPSFGYLKVLFCGLPVSIGESAIGLSQECEPSRLIESISEVMAVLARTTRASLSIAKDFTDEERPVLDHFLEHDFLCGQLPYLYKMKHEFEDFSAYLQALKSDYRQEINRTKKKFMRAGFSIETVRGEGAITHVYSNELHSLYEAVVQQAEHRLELLPESFFHGLAHAFPEDSNLTVVKNDGPIIAFSYSLKLDAQFYFLFLGLDYEKIHSGDVYNNVFYHDMEIWLQSNCPIVRMGQASDEFKSRLGGQATPLFAYVRASGWIGWILRKYFAQLFPPQPAPRARAVFKARGT